MRKYRTLPVDGPVTEHMPTLNFVSSPSSNQRWLNERMFSLPGVSRTKPVAEQCLKKRAANAARTSEVEDTLVESSLREKQNARNSPDSSMSQDRSKRVRHMFE